jgi:serine/threonine-protein kinase
MKKLLGKPFVRKTIIILIGFIFVIILLDNLIIPWYVSSPETTIPNVVGMNDQEAIEMLENQGFETAIGDTSYGLEYPKNTVFLQRPKAGDVVKEGRRIFLFVSGGEKIVYVPMLKGKSILDAKFALERIGLKLGRVNRIPSSKPEDMIFDQEYVAGTRLLQGEIVGITVSAGRGGGSVLVPDLIGKSLSEAQLILSENDLIVGKINYQASATLLPNTVLDQYPSSGNKLNPGDEVDLFVTISKNSSNPSEGTD